MLLHSGQQDITARDATRMMSYLLMLINFWNLKAFASADFDKELGGQFLFSDHDNMSE
ncbi:hypothetical protein SORBI_3008G088875 [Sorghum bicolor]|uniref:Uncharacterized protein n=1 Tax=Sorghum bicolor TaxID=4558 RepID=A0A109NDQ1_SORBI|nr:hypothetical protein SORBI_3008G088875 [Sorghum bicolor]